MQYDAIILAGGENNPDFKGIAPFDNEALILIGNHPMVYYVYKALRESPLVRKIVISGPVDALKAQLPFDEQLFFVAGGSKAIDSFANAANFLSQEGISPKILISPADIPFITSAAVDDFITQCQAYPADFYYPIVARESNEKKFPGVKRTYVNLKEGVFTGGNLFLLSATVIDKCLYIGGQLEQRRKAPLEMAKLFGFKLVLAYLFKQLSIPQAEKRFFEVVGIKGKGIVSAYAEVGVDVDKSSDLEIARRYLQAN
jgi:molybdopterin-guanine dinucleotide biosynthesis protein A